MIKQKSRSLRQIRWRMITKYKFLLIVLPVLLILVLAAKFHVANGTEPSFSPQHHSMSIGENSHGRLRGKYRLSTPSTVVGESLVHERAHFDHLVLVTGHSTLTRPCVTKSELESNSNTPWYLLDYQRTQDLPFSILNHLQMGIKLVNEDPSALLVFSGGQTRKDAMPMSEALSYYIASESMNWFNTGTIVKKRTYLEEFATDSLENVLFTLCRFRELTGRYPTKISLISFAYKEKRFEHFVQKVLRWKPSSYNFFGIDPPSTSSFNLDYALTQEQNLLDGLQSYPFGCGDESIDRKRDARNPFSRSVPYALSCPDIATVLNYCGSRLFPAKLPWAW